MKKTLGLLVLLFLALALFAAEDQSSSLLALDRSALHSVSYFGSVDDLAYNPASLPLLEGETVYQVSYGYGERFRGDSGRLSYINEPEGELKGVVKSGPVALSAKLSSYLDGKEERGGKTYFDVYSGIDMEVTVGWSFLDHFAVGAKLGGGNSMARFNKEIDGFLLFAENALFSPFERIEDSERLSSGIGFLSYSGPFTFGFYSDGVLSLLTNFNAGIKEVLAGTTVSVSYEGPQYNSSDDLSLIVPRVSASYTGFSPSIEKRAIVFQGDITLQPLKNIFLDGGVVYSHVVEEGSNTRTLGFSVYGSYYNYGLSLNGAFGLGEKLFIPSVVFTYAR